MNSVIFLIRDLLISLVFPPNAYTRKPSFDNGIYCLIEANAIYWFMSLFMPFQIKEFLDLFIYANHR